MILKEINQDLFKMDTSYALAHCVGADFKMSKGIAVRFKNKFGNVADLLQQEQSAGGLAILKDHTRYIYYLVTKDFSTLKPTYKTLAGSLYKLKQHMKEHKVKKLAIPTIGCGLDRLNWNKVKVMLKDIFETMEIKIVVCIWSPLVSKRASRSISEEKQIARKNQPRRKALERYEIKQLKRNGSNKKR